MTTTATPQNAVRQAKPAATLPHGLSPKRLLELLGQMMLIRRFEERTAQSYQQAKIGGFCHL